MGQNVELGVWRKGETMKIAVTTGELLTDRPRRGPAAPQPEQREEDINRFGLQVQELTKEVATRLKLNVQQGVIVTDVADNSMAAAQDIPAKMRLEGGGRQSGHERGQLSRRPNESRSEARDSAFTSIAKGSRTFAVVRVAAGKSHVSC